MKCMKCGNENTGDCMFCIHCGMRLENSKVEEKKTESKIKVTSEIRGANGFFMVPTDMTNLTPPLTPPPSKKKRKKWPIILGSVLLFVVALVIGLAIYAFPISVSVETKEKTKTTVCLLEDFQIEVSSNQPIVSVSYAVSPKNKEADDEYIRLETSGSMFNKEVTIDELQIIPGENELWIWVKTWFGEERKRIKLECEIGYTSAPETEAFVQVAEDMKLISNELLIVFADGTSEKAIEKLIEEYDGTIVGQIYFMNQYQVRFSGMGETYINDIKERLEAEDIVEKVFFNVSIDTISDYYPNDGEFDSWNTNDPAGNNWGLECINAPGAWDYADEMSVVKIGVIDSFLYNQHTDLKINMDHVYALPTNDFPTAESLAEYYEKHNDTHTCLSWWDACTFCGMRDHGTHVSGIIGALFDNGKGVAGVFPNAEIYFATGWYYTIPQEGQLESSSSDAGFCYDIVHLVTSGCRVINMSLGSVGTSEVDQYEISSAENFDFTIQKLEEAGYDFLIIKAAGNDNNDASKYRLNRIYTYGDYAKRHTIIVGAVENASSIINRLASWMGDGKKIYNMARYSNYGSMVDITAPGSNIYNTIYGNQYKKMSGTSMATPTVSGVVGMMYAINPNLDCDYVKAVLCFTGEQFCSKNTEVYWIVNAKNAVEWVRENSKWLPERETPVIGFVTGLVQDANTMELIGSASLRITNEQSNEVYEACVLDGTYECYLEPGVYTLEFASGGYSTETIYHVEITEGEVRYNVLLNMVPEVETVGYANGCIVDAFDASKIKYAEIKIFDGINQTQGTPILTTQSDAYGYYTAELAPGNYTLCVSMEGYTTGTANIVVVGGMTKSNQDCALTPNLKNGEMRIVLTWGDYPSDLDSHLVGPSPNGSFHVYYDDKNAYYDGVLYNNLDVDDTDSYGPETTSVYVGVNGEYTFYVHNYSDRSYSNSSSMATSGAQVKLYIGGVGEPIIYNVPNQAGTLWKVFSVKDGIVTSINEMDYHESPSTIGY